MTINVQQGRPYAEFGQDLWLIVFARSLAKVSTDLSWGNEAGYKSMSIKYISVYIIDIISCFLVILAMPALKFISRARSRGPISRALLDHFNIAVLRHHYYEPVVFQGDLYKSLDLERTLPGLKLDEARQLELIHQFHYRDELLNIPTNKVTPDKFGYNNGSYESGDAELLYDIIRHYKPKRIIEIGSGQSTLMAKIALSRNSAEGSQECLHVCIEPYEQPWLESKEVNVIRKRVEFCDKSIFDTLEENDILFIDSSHIIRPQGDILYEYLEIIPVLKKGVLIHVHDIFTPRDYPRSWIVDDRRLWNEQYLLEAFLSFNSNFRILLAANWLNNNHFEKLTEACPVLMQQQGKQPGAFWFTRDI